MVEVWSVICFGLVLFHINFKILKITIIITFMS